MKLRKLAVLLTALTFSLFALAEMPYTFENGQIGDADHINANFEYLDVRLSALDGGISPLDHGIIYSHVSTSVGSLVTIGSVDYRLFKVPFIDPYNGEKYHIETLSSQEIESFFIVGSRAGDIEITNQLISVSKATSIDGNASLIVENCSYQFANGDQSTRCSTDIYIYLDDLVLVIQVDGLSIDSETYEDFNDYDFTASDTLSEPAAVNNDSHIDTFIDHIKIEKVSL